MLKVKKINKSIGQVNSIKSGKSKRILSGGEIFKFALMKFRGHCSTHEYKEIIALLTPYIEENSDNVLALKILAFSLLETDDEEEALFYFKKALSINRNDVEALNAMSFLVLSENNIEQSINYLLDAIYIEKDNNKLKQNLEKIRNIKDPKVFLSMNKPADFIFIRLPRERLINKIQILTADILSLPLVRAIGVTGGIVLLLFLLYPVFRDIVKDYLFKNGIGHGRVTHVAIQDIDKLVEERSKYNIKLSGSEVKTKFDSIKTYLQENQHNRAVIVINELLNSNASEFIKERVRVLQMFLPDVTVQTIDFTPQVQDVIKIPFLYKDVFVRWNGTIANLEHKARKETAFDLLINFVDNAVVEGIAETHYDGFLQVLSGEKVAVFGQIAGITVDNKIILKGKEIQRIGR